MSFIWFYIQNSHFYSTNHEVFIIVYCISITTEIWIHVHAMYRLLFTVLNTIFCLHWTADRMLKMQDKQNIEMKDEKKIRKWQTEMWNNNLKANSIIAHYLSSELFYLIIIWNARKLKRMFWMEWQHLTDKYFLHVTFYSLFPFNL